MFDLKKIRDERGLTQQALADALNNNKLSEDDEIVTQEMVSRYENNSKNIPAWYLLKLQMYTGENLFSFKQSSKPLEVEETIYKQKILLNLVKEHCKKKYYYSEITGKFSDMDGEIKNEKHINYIKGLFNLTDSLDKKPRIVLIGNSDTGKSSMINTLIGKDIMPTKWQPYTTIPVFVKHIKDKPPYIKSEAIIFKENTDTDIFNIEGIKNQEYFDNWKLTEGDNLVLKEYGTRENGKEEVYCSAAVIFAEASILENVDIIDLPGFNTDRPEDDIISNKETNKADILIFLSQANGFMKKHEFEYLLEAIKRLKIVEKKEINNFTPLNNLYILASHADNIGTEDERNFILNSAVDRLNKVIPDGYWDSRSEESDYEYSKNELLKRFYNYSNNNVKIRSRFESDLKKVIEDIASYTYDLSIAEYRKFTSYYSEELEKEINELSSILEERDRYKQLLKGIELGVVKTGHDSEESRKKVFSKIKQYSVESDNEIAIVYEEVMNTDFIVNSIKLKEYKKNKEDLELLVSFLSQTLKIKIEKILKNKSEFLAKDIDQYIDETSKSFEFNNNFNFKGINSFNVKGIFFAGLAGLATLGALGIWAAIAAAGSNLGAYILLAQGVSFLSALGISLGGTAAVATAVSTIGGPITVGIVLSIIAAIGVFVILTGGWEKKIAKKIISEFEKQDASTKYRELVKEFWKDTEKAFIIGANEIETKWNEYVEDLKKKVNSYSIEDIKSLKKEAENLLNFIKSIPNLF